jgi:hypothetical protein
MIRKREEPKKKDEKMPSIPERSPSTEACAISIE